MSPAATKPPPPLPPIDIPSKQEGTTEGPLSSKQKAFFTAKLIENDSKEEEDEDVSDSDTDDDDGVDKNCFIIINCYIFLFVVTTMSVKAIYNYTGRNLKELSFSAGEILQVAEKTSDGNWWDGFHKSRRGYIPTTYVEIMEVRSTLKSPLPPRGVARLDLMVGQNTSLVTYILLTTQHAASYVRLLRAVV